MSEVAVIIPAVPAAGVGDLVEFTATRVLKGVGKPIWQDDSRQQCGTRSGLGHVRRSGKRTTERKRRILKGNGAENTIGVQILHARDCAADRRVVEVSNFSANSVSIVGDRNDIAIGINE